MSALVVSAIAALLVAWGAGSVLAKTVRMPRLVDALDGDRASDLRMVPRIGGVAVLAGTIAGVVAAFVVIGPGSSMPGAWLERAPWLASAGVLLFAVGLADDLRGVQPVAKLSVQTVAAAALWQSGSRIETLLLPGGVTHDLGAWGLPITWLWFVGVSNAFNLVDGIDGLAATVAIVALALIGTGALALHNASVIVLCTTLGASMVAFLILNWPPARLFLGDCGSLTVGMLLAVLSIEGARGPGGGVHAVIPPLVLAYPLVDTLAAMLRRFFRGDPLSRADGRHIHHQLIAAEVGPRTAVVALGLFTLVSGLLGLSITFARPVVTVMLGLGAGFATLLAIGYGVRVLQYDEFIEAGVALAGAVQHGRSLLRDKILARQLARSVAAATDVDAVDPLLAAAAPNFRFAHMQVCRESSRRNLPAESLSGSTIWKLDFPLAPGDAHERDPMVLRIWCFADPEVRPANAERVARILAPTVHERLAADPSRLPQSVRKTNQPPGPEAAGAQERRNR